MNHLRSVLGMVTGTTPSMKDAVDNEKEMNLAPSKPTGTKTKDNKTKLANASPSSDDDGSLSSLSFYEDFPTLYFAVRKGRYVNNSVFLSWDSARKHIVDYPEAEYIATPTLEQAHQYTNNNMGEFELDASEDESTELETETVESSQTKKPPPKTKAKPQQNDSPKPTLRSLILEFYKLERDQIRQFLNRQNMLSQRDIFIKHWHRSGLMIMCNERTPFELAEVQYDRWFQGNENKKDAKASRKRKRLERDDKRKQKLKSIPNPSTAIDTSGTKPEASATKEKSPPPNKLKKGARTKDEIWKEKYERLKVFRAEYGHTRMHVSYDKKLYGWVAYTRRRMYRSTATCSDGSPLEVWQIKLLNDIDFDIPYKRVFQQFEKFIGKRVAKLFDLETTHGVGTKVRKKVPFFGTVMGISDVKRKYLHVLYDDGDSEDYDLAWLKQGQELYRRYKHKDFRTPLPYSNSTPKETASTEKGPSKNDDTKGTASNASKYAATGAATNRKSTGSPTAALKPATAQPANDSIDFEDFKKKVNDATGAATNRKSTDSPTAALKPATAQPVNDAIDFEDFKKKVNEFFENTANNQEASITPATNQNEKERQNSDQNINTKVNNDQLKEHSDNNGNESDDSDEVEIVEVRVPYRPNPNLFSSPDNALSMSMINNTNDFINNDVVNNDVMNAVVNQNVQNTIRNTMRANMHHNSRSNPYNMFRKGFYDF